MPWVPTPGFDTNNYYYAVAESHVAYRMLLHVVRCLDDPAGETAPQCCVAAFCPVLPAPQFCVAANRTTVLCGCGPLSSLTRVSIPYPMPQQHKPSSYVRHELVSSLRQCNKCSLA